MLFGEKIGWGKNYTFADLRESQVRIKDPQIANCNLLYFRKVCISNKFGKSTSLRICDLKNLSAERPPLFYTNMNMVVIVSAFRIQLTLGLIIKMLTARSDPPTLIIIEALASLYMLTFLISLFKFYMEFKIL
jgi:hypothetical protein